MQGSTVKQDIEAGGIKSTSTPEMMKLVFISAIAAVVQAVALIGWITAEVDAGLIKVGFISLDPPLTSIVFFAAAFVVPTALATPVVMFTHWKPDSVLLGSKQFTDSLRGRFVAPFLMKYLYGIQAVMNGVALASLKYQFFWPAALNIVNIGLYSAGLFLVFQHFKNPNVPTDLATVAASMVGGTMATGRIDSLEQDVKTLKQEVQELKYQLAMIHPQAALAVAALALSPSANEAVGSFEV